MGMPVAEVRSVLLADAEDRGALIAAHLGRLEQQLASTQEAVRALRRLLEPTPDELEVQLQSVPARVVAGVAGEVDKPDVLSWYSGAMAELTSLGQTESGPPGGLYDNELFTDDHGRVLAYLTVTDPRAAGRVTAIEIPEAELATTLHRGSHHDIDLTYARLGTWVADGALAMAGPVHETYLVGPRDTPDASAWRTEIGWPVFRTAGWEPRS